MEYIFLDAFILFRGILMIILKTRKDIYTVLEQIESILNDLEERIERLERLK